MLWKQLFETYPGAFLGTVIFPVVAGLVAFVGSFFGSWGGYENLKGRLALSQQSQRIEQGVKDIRSDKSELQSTLRLMESIDRKNAEYGKRDAVLAALINQYQQLSRAATLFGQMSQRDPSQDQGKIAAEMLKILNQDVVRAFVRDDLPGNPLLIEVQPNSFRVIFPVPMRVPPKLSFTGLPAGVSANVSDKTEISFTVSFLPTSIPVKTFGFEASAEL
jgi:hypothetical protein